MSLGGIVGAGIGFFIGGPSGALTGYSLGSTAEALLNPKTIEGPRLDELKTQLSVYGAPIPFEWGSNRHAGTVMWPKELVAVETKNTQSSSKGGPETTTYSYAISCAVLVCEGPIVGIRRMWANKKLVYDASVANTGKVQDPAMPTVRIYLGTEGQAADPLITATDGPSPAYLGSAYVVFENYDVTELGGRPPQWEFEVLTAGSVAVGSLVNMGNAGGDAAIDPNTGYIWSVTGIVSTSVEVFITNNATQSLVQHLSFVPPSLASSLGRSICYLPVLNEFWITNENGTNIVAVNATSYTARYLNINGGVSWLGKIRYSDTFSNIIVGTSNINSLVYVLEQGATTASIILDPPSGPLVTEIVSGKDGISDFAVYPGGVVRMSIGGAASTIVQTFPTALTGVATRAVYDSSKNRLLMVGQGGFGEILVLDLGTGVYTNMTIAAPADVPAEYAFAFSNILHHKQNNKYYIAAHQAGKPWTLITVNPDTFVAESVRTFSGPAISNTMIEMAGVYNYFVLVESSSGTAWRIPIGGRLAPNQIALSTIVSDLCVRAGLQTSDINVTALTDLVDGYIVPRQMTARAAIEPLQQAYYFDAVESDDKIKFVKRGAAIAATIPLIERSARESGQEPSDSLAINRAFEFELPAECDVEYPDVAADYLVGNQYERRITKDTRQKINLQTPVVMPASKAKQIARVTLYQAWLNQNYRWTTSRAYAHLEPTDVVALPTANASYAARITNKTEQPNGVIEWQGQMEDANAYLQDGAGAVALGYLPQTIFSPPATILVLLDVPIMRDEDDSAGYYVAMAGVI